MAGESGKKQADNFDTSVKKLEAVITRLRKAVTGQKKALTKSTKSETTLVAEKQVLFDGLNALKDDYETLAEAFDKIKTSMKTKLLEDGLEDFSTSDEVKKLKDIIETQTFDYETLKASIDFIKEEHKNLIEKSVANEKLLARDASKNNGAGSDDKGLQIELDAALKENKKLKQKNKVLQIELDEQEKHMENFTRQLALGKNIKTILNKRIDATIIQLEDMLQRQGG
jgi:chromosome segregation ATPase